MVSACGGDARPAATPPAVRSTPGATAAPTDRDQLAGVAAAAKDRRYVARYTLMRSGRGRPSGAPGAGADAGAGAATVIVTVTVAVATDGSWLVAVPAGALGGLADVAMVGSSAGLFQCLLGPATGTVGTRPDSGLPPVGCVRVARLAAAVDPRVQHVFTDWIDALVDRSTALSVAVAPPLPGARGTCYSVESTSAALAPPVDPGVYCYEPDGVLTAARVGFGTLTLTGPVGTGPPSVTMPAAVVTRPPVGTAAPPPQSSLFVP